MQYCPLKTKYLKNKNNYSQLKIIPSVKPNDYKIRQTLNGKMYPLNGLNMNSLNNRLNVKKFC